MKRGTKKSPIQHVPKTKEQLLHEAKLNAKRVLIKERFYPALVEATDSVEEAGMLLGAISQLIMAEAMETLNSKKMDEIKKKVAHKLTQEQGGEGILQMEKLLDVFDGLSLFETRVHMESMKSVIEQMKIEEFQARKLADMHPLWDKYLH